jgi:hypothetical protein
MSKKTKTWSRLLALFGCTVVAFAFAIVLSPTAAAAAWVQADVDLTAGNLNPGTAATNNEVVELTITEGGNNPLWLDTFLVDNTGTATNAEIAKIAIYRDGSDIDGTGANGTCNETNFEVASTTSIGAGFNNAGGITLGVVNTEVVKIANAGNARLCVVIDYKTDGSVVDGSTFDLTVSATVDDGSTSTDTAAVATNATSVKTTTVVATKLVISGVSSTAASPAAQFADNINVTVTAVDANSNTDVDDVSTFTVSLTDASDDAIAGVTSNTGTLSSGTATLAAMQITAADLTATTADGDGLKLIATDTLGGELAASAADATLTINFIATKLVVTGTASHAVTTTNELTVTAKDANSNTDTGYSGSKVLTFSGPAVSPAGDVPIIESEAGLVITVTFTSGVSPTNGLTLTAKKVEVTTVDVSDTSLVSTGAEGDDLDLTVTVGAANKLMIATQASTTVLTSQAFATQPVIRVTDVYGNTITGATTTITGAVYTDAACSAGASGTLSSNSVAAAAGIATFTGMNHSNSGTFYVGYSGTYTAACSGAAATLLTGASASAVTVSASSSSGAIDSTAPAAPSAISISVNSSNQVVITWVDPTATDYSNIKILRGKNISAVNEIVYAAVTKGLQTYTDTAVSVGDELKYVLLVQDDSGNSSRSAVQSITIAAGATVTPATPATPAVPGVSPATPATPATPASPSNRYQQAGVSESEVDSAVGAFRDLKKSAWHAPFIARMKKLAVLAGYPDGSVKPDKTINRAELAKIAAKAFDLTSATESFSDVANDAWFAPFVGALQSAGAAWTTTANYQPSGDVTRGEALQTLLIAAGVSLDNVTVAKLFPDVSTRHRFAAAITYASQNGVVSGYDNGNFGPGDTLTRGQVAKIVSLVKDL